MTSDGTVKPATSPLTFQRVLITGAGGFVGRRLLERIMPRLSPDARIFRAARSPGLREDTVTEVLLDLGDSPSVVHAVKEVEPDLILHLAAQSSVAQTGADAAATWRVNLGGTLALAEAIAASAPHATLLFTSSSEVYGQAFNKGVATEQTAPDPQSAYARSKLAAEQMLRDVLPASTTLVVARPSNHSGAGQDDRFVLPSFASQIARHQPVVRVGNLAAERDFLHVDDVVDAYLALLDASDRLGPRSVFNISSGVARPVGMLLDRMIALSGYSVAVEIDPDRLRPSDIPVAAIDSSVLRQKTGWAPTRAIDEMLAELLGAAEAERPGQPQGFPG